VEINESQLKKVGELSERYLTDENIWRIFTIILSSKSAKSSTYKYSLIKSIIEKLYQVNEQSELTYDQLAYSFTIIYWNLIVNHKLMNQNRGKQSRVVTIIKDGLMKYSIPPEFRFDKIDVSFQLKLVGQVKSVTKINVFGALYGDSRGDFYAFDHTR